MQWFSAYQDQVCAWFNLARQPTEAARKLFQYHFLKEMALSFVFWLLEPVQCPGKTLFLSLYFIFYLLPSHVDNIILILKTFLYFKTAEGKTL